MLSHISPSSSLRVAIRAAVLAAWLGVGVTHAAHAQPQSSSQPPRDFRVTLLGTGSPVPGMTRFGASILVEAGDQVLLFDAGRGAAQRLAQLGVNFTTIDAVLFTHLHSDHVVGLPDVWLTGWTVDRRTVPWEVIGPTGTQAMADHLMQAFAFDMRMRVEDGKRDPNGGRLLAHDVAPGVVYDRGGVRVTAFVVDHRPVEPAYGYRIEHEGRTVVLSGDTKRSETVITTARGVDLLVHEVVLAPMEVTPAAPYYRAWAHHTTPEQAADVFERARPTLALYSHVVVFGDVDEAMILERTRRTYRGPVLLGQDLMSIAVGDTVASPRVRPAAPRRTP